MKANIITKLSAYFLSTTFMIFSCRFARADTESEINDIARNITVEVVSLAVNGDQNFTPSGSGVILKKEGSTYYVVTNEHVVSIEDDYLIIINNDDQFTEPPAEEVEKIEKYSEPPDLALLTFTSQQNYEQAELGSVNSLKEGETVYVAGFPSAVEQRDNSIKFTPLRLTNQNPILVGQSLTYQPIQPTNNVEKGMSGGSVLNQEGQLVGIHQGETNDRTAGQGIPLNTILATFPSIQSESKFVQREAETPTGTVETIEKLLDIYELGIIVNYPPLNEPAPRLK